MSERAAITVIEQGALQVNEAYVRRSGANIVAVEVDMRSKYGAPAWSCGNELWLEAIDSSMHLNPDAPREAYTGIRFDGFDPAKWELYCSRLSRYTLSVVFIRRERWIEDKARDVQFAWWRFQARFERWWNGTDA